MYCILLLSVVLSLSFFFFNDTATTEIYTLSLHDALPILRNLPGDLVEHVLREAPGLLASHDHRDGALRAGPLLVNHEGRYHVDVARPHLVRSEEHTSELQSHLNLVCRLLLEKKKNRLRPSSDCSPSPPGAAPRSGPPLTLCARKKSRPTPGYRWQL